MKKHFTQKIVAKFAAVMVCVALSVTALSQTVVGARVKPVYVQSTSKLTDVTDKYDLDSVRSEYFNEDVVKKNTTAAQGECYVIVDLGGSGAYGGYGGSVDFDEYLETSAAAELVRSLELEQNAVLRRMSSAGIDYSVRYSYTTLNNALAVKIDSADIDRVASIKGVKGVYRSETYAVPSAVAVSNNANVYSTGIYDSSDVSYKGDGMVVAILDTGLDYTHDAFSTMPPESEGRWEKEYVAQRLPDTVAASERTEGLTVDDVFYNLKVPYAYDYADSDADVFPSYSAHGTHVAGIVAGRDDGKIVNKETGETFIGVAPNAQLAIMKVFTDDLDSKLLGGADSVDILAAINDCAALGVDVINMSLGTSGGFSDESHDAYISGVYGRVEELGISLVVAAGNEYSSGFGGANGTNLASNPDSGTVSSPSTYSAALSVASINGQESAYFLANSTDGNDGTVAFLTEASDANSNEFNFIEGIYEAAGADKSQPLTLNYVVVDGVGRPINYTTAVKRALSDGRTIALVKRGDISFEEKVENAMANNAIGVIIYNNLSGVIRMSLGDIENPVPTCSIGMDAGQLMVDNAVSKKGTVTFSSGYTAGPFMSDFSSWGPTPDLKLKPEITAHGGEITSAVPGGYDEYSGTSMAAPNMAGAVALLRQHVKATAGLTGTALRSRVNQILMSTATMALNEEGNPYSPRKQGAGLADIDSAVNTESFIYVNNDGVMADKTKLELGDDKQRTGVYYMEFVVKNISGNAVTYTPQAFVMTETLASDEKTVAEKAYMLDYTAEYTVNGSAAQSVTVPADGEVTVNVRVTLAQSARNYIEESFVNGMYVEGFIRLYAEDGGEVDLGIPFLAFYGDWTAAPLFDYTTYEISESVAEEEDVDKQLKATASPSTPLGLYDNGQYIIPLGTYLYNMSEEDTEIVASDEKAAVSMYDTNSRRTVYELYMIYAGLLRGAKTLHLTITDASTGEVVFDRTDYNARKSYAAGGANIGSPVVLSINPNSWGMANNRTYIMDLTGTLDYPGGENPDKNNFSFKFTVDYEAPTIRDYRIRYEPYTENRETKYRIYMDVDVFDNQYAQSLLPCYVKDNMLYLLTEFPVPVYSERNSLTTVSFEITDIYDKYVKTGQFYLGVEDYAMNQTIYQVNAASAIDYPEEITFATDGKLISSGTKSQTVITGGQTVTNVYNTYTLELAPNEAFKLSPTALPEGTAATKLEWSVSNDRVRAYEDEIFAVSAGKATATLKANGMIRAQISVNVSGEAVQAPLLEKMSFRAVLNGTDFIDNLADGEVSLNPNSSLQLEVDLDPWYCSGIELEWESSNNNVLTVDQNGLVRTLKKGTAFVTVRAKGYDRMSKTLRVQVGSDFYVLNYTLMKYYGGPEVVIPDELNVLYIDADAFKGNTEITSVVISKTVAEIDENAFENCVNLRKVTIPSECTVIKERAFAGCVNLTEIELKPFQDKIDETHYDIGTLTLGRYAFYNCRNLTTITNPERLKTANDHAFAGCTSLVSLDISGLRVAGERVFENCTSLKEVVMDADTAVSPYMFAGCTSLESIDYTVKTVPEGAFYGCTSLAQVNFADGLEYIGGKAFSGTGLTALTLPDGNVTIGENAFSGCAALTTLTLSSGTVIGLGSFMPFSGCAALEAVNVEAGNTLYSSEGGILYNSDKTEIVMFPPALTDYNIADTVVRIGAGAFAGTGLTSVDLTGITSIGEYAFAGTGIVSVILPESMTYVAEGAFRGCKSLSSLTVGGATEIGDYAFYGCTQLTTVSLPDTTRYIGNYAFGDSGAESVVMNGVTEVGDYAFYNSRITSLNAPALARIGESAFSSSSALKTVILGAVTEMGDTAFYGCNALREVTFGDGSTVVGDGAFMRDAAGGSLTSVTLPDTVREIGDLAFYNCSALTQINLSGVTTVGVGAFAACTALPSADLGNATEIGDAAFFQAGNLGSVRLDNAIEIGDAAFQDSGLVSVTMPVAEIVGEYAFAGTKLTTVEIPASIDSLTYADSWWGVDSSGGKPGLIEGKQTSRIGVGAFSDITTLTSITVAEGNPVFVSFDGVLYSAVPDGWQLEQYPAGRAGDSYTVKEGTVRINAGAFENAVNLKEITVPYTLEAIGSYAFFGSSVKKFTFEAVEAPILESTYVSPESVSGDPVLYAIFGTDSIQQVGSRIFYANFSDYVAKVVEEKAIRDAGNTTYKAPDFGLTIVRPENGTGYDTIIWKGFFSQETLSAYAAQRVTRQAVDLIAALPAVDEVRAILGTGSKDEQLSAVRTLSSETVQVARSAYNLITTDRQREFVTNYQTLLDVEKAVRDVKSELGAAAQIASVTLKSRPTKLEYKAGETFDPTGMVVVAVYDDLSEITVTDYTVDKTVLAMGDSQVTISYGGSSAVVYISVSSADSTDTGNEGGSGGKKGCGCGGVATGASIPLAVFGLALTYILMRRRKGESRR